MQGYVGKALGEKLKALRRSQGLTLRDVCAHLSREGIELSEATLNRVENARTMLRLDVARKVFRLLGTPLDYVDEIIAEAESRQVIDATGYSFDELRREGDAARLVGDQWKALAHFQAAYDKAKLELGGRDPRGMRADRRLIGTINRMARVMIDLADCHRRLRQFRLALGPPGRLLDLPHLCPDNRLGGVLVHATVWGRMERFYRARVYAEHAAKRLHEGSRKLQAYGYGVIGFVLFDQDRFEEAIPHQEKSVRLHRLVGDEMSALHVSSVLAFAYFKIGYPTRARSMLEGAYRVFAREGGHAEFATLALAYLGQIEFELGLYDEARERLKACASLARRFSRDAELFLATYRLWRVELATGHDKARRRHERTLQGLLPRLDPTFLPVREFVAAKRMVAEGGAGPGKGSAAVWH